MTDAPTITGSVIGYRAWRIREWKLAGTGVYRTWEPGINEATCDAGQEPNTFGLTFSFGTSSLFGTTPHTAPGVHCHCGINALARFARKDEHWQDADVLGAIEAWSETPEGDHANEDEPGFVLHPTGFRARYGKVILLATDDDYPRAQNAAIRALAAEHGADVCRREHLEDAAKEHGQLVPEETLKWVRDNQEPDPIPDDYWTTIHKQILQMGGGSSGSYYLMPSGHGATWQALGGYVPTLQPTRPKRPLRPRGVKQTLGYVGSPNHGTHKRGDRVADCRGRVYICTRGGRPGTWEADSAA